MPVRWNTDLIPNQNDPGSVPTYSHYLKHFQESLERSNFGFKVKHCKGDNGLPFGVIFAAFTLPFYRPLIDELSRILPLQSLDYICDRVDAQLTLIRPFK